MKKIIVILAVILSAMMFTLEVSKLHANSVELKMLEFVTHDQDVVFRDYFEPGTDLTDLEIPDAPDKDGFIFVGWSVEIPEEMPNYHVRIEAQYMRSEVVVHEHIG
jgi:tRNA A37 threonylcarbamoyladenosine biosynthesis protein TsaE